MSRRTFLGASAGAVAGLALGGAAALTGPMADEASAAAMSVAQRRRSQAYEIRQQAAMREMILETPTQPTNGDEQRYPTKIASFSKALPHDATGQVDLDAYQRMTSAVDTGSYSGLEALTLGGTTKLVSPLAAWAYHLEGTDIYQFGIPEPPAFAAAGEAAEMAQVYWQALARDVPFANYGSDPTITRAATDLSTFTALKGPKVGGAVSSATIFRGDTAGDLIGPYLSQFLWKEIPFGVTPIEQLAKVPAAGEDFLTTRSECLASQRGHASTAYTTYDSTRRYLRNGRDLGEYVHSDLSFQAFLGAAAVLWDYGSAALAASNPYRASYKQAGFAMFGLPHILDVVTRVAQIALKAAWYQKWLLHKRLRPEAFGLRVDVHKEGLKTYPIHAELLDSDALAAVYEQYDNYLLPVSYPEGCPAHPAYPSGHATIAGAGATILKAFFNESFSIPDPVQASADGSSLLPYSGQLKVGDELNKLAANIAIGRVWPGVHWRSDGTEGMRLGEALAVSVLRDFKYTYREQFGGFRVTLFDGRTQSI